MARVNDSIQGLDVNPTPIRQKVTVVTPEEVVQALRLQRVAKESLKCPSPSAVLPPPMLLGANLNMPTLGQKISNLSGIEGADRVDAARASAFAKVEIPGSVYDLAAKPVDVPVTSRVEEPVVNLEELEETLDQLAIAAQEKLGMVEEAIEELSDEEVEEIFPDATPFPNLAREIMNLGIGMEGFQTSKLAAYKKQGDKYKEKINLLLSLSSHLPKLSAEDAPPEGLKQETMDKILEIHEQLKAEGIDIFPDLVPGAEISKEQLLAANSLINHHIDVCRTSLQELFTTKISVVIQFLSMMNEVMKKIAEKDDQQKRKANQLPSH